MAAVKDTQSFIEAAVAIHGNRYDYSRAKWSGTEGKITLICRVCGPFEITASSHYRQDKKCGCRECALKSRARRSGEYQICPYCRKWAKYRGAGKHCSECRETHKQRKAEWRRAEKTRPCAKCGRDFYHEDPRKVFCSAQCTKADVVTVACGECSRPVTRYKSHVDKYPAVFCGVPCQMMWRTRRSNEARQSNVDWIARSKKAKTKWKRTDSNKRRRANEWLQAANREQQRLQQRQSKASPWARRCQAAVVSLAKREPPTNKPRKVLAARNWRESSKRQLKALVARTQRQVRGPWKRKCDTAGSNLRKKARLRARA